MNDAIALYPLHPGNPGITHVKSGAFSVSGDQKIDLIAKHFGEIMEVLGLDMSDEVLKETPKRVATMYVKEMFNGLLADKPVLSLPGNKFNYTEMLVEKDIRFFSCREYDLVPITGKIHVGYFATDKMIRLTDINRLTEYYARRPQVQERLTIQLAEALKSALNTDHVAVIIDTMQLYATGGSNNSEGSAISSYYSGRFKNEKTRSEFLSFIHKT